MSGKPKAAVVDNVDVCRDFLAELLHDSGYEVVKFPDAESFLSTFGLEGQRAHDRLCIDLLIIDNRLPGLSGLDLLGLLNIWGGALFGGRKAICSGNWTAQERLRAENYGCRVFSKPYDLPEIIAWLENQRTRPVDRLLQS